MSKMSSLYMDISCISLVSRSM